jgi:hypothetical protein
MNDYNAVRIIKIVGYTLMAGSLGLTMIFMSMI